MREKERERENGSILMYSFQLLKNFAIQNLDWTTEYSFPGLDSTVNWSIFVET